MTSDQDQKQAEILHKADQRDEGVVHTLTVSNPEKLNVLSIALMEELGKRLEACDGDANARVILLRGAGTSAWIGGIDVRELAGLDANQAVDFMRRMHGLCEALRKITTPVIAVIRGYCLGAGLDVAMCCDIRVATENSSFGLPEVRAGLPSVVETGLLPGMIGHGRARDLVMTGRLIDARTAWRWGLVDGIIPVQGLEAFVETRVDDFLMAAPRAVRLQKRLCKIWEERPLADGIEAGYKAFRRAFEGDEAKKYLDPFATKDD